MSGWAQRTVSSLLVDASPGFASGEDLDEGTFQIRMNNVTSEGALDLKKRRRVTLKGKRNGDLLLKPGDVLFNSTNSPELVGKLALFPGIHEPTTFSNHFVRLRPKEGNLDGSFLSRWLHLQFQRGVFRGLCKQWVNQATVSRELLLALELPLPPLPEQRRIAAILDQADALRAKRREALAQLDSLTQSIFIEMFGGQQSQDWPNETIVDVAALHDGSIRTGPFGSQLLHSEFVAEGVAVLGIDNAAANEFRWGERRFISEAKYRELRRYTVKPGDVLITIMGTCGRCAVVPDDIPAAINTKHLCCITLNPVKCLPEFLHAFFLRHPMARSYLEQTSKGAIMSGLNMGLIKTMPISVPPLALQQTFATRNQSVETLKATHRAALAELDALFASLQHRAFAGTL